MTMPQLIDPNRFSAVESLWTGDALDGERLDEYVENELAHKPHHGDTAISVTVTAEAETAKAAAAAEAALSSATSNRDEAARIATDMQAIHLMSAFYRAKAASAAEVLLYAHTRDLNHLDRAEKLLAESVEEFRKLAALTSTTYRDAAALHASHRRIPVVATTNTLDWTGVLPTYEKELDTFRKRLALLRSGSAQTEAKQEKLPQAAFTLTSGGESFPLAAGATLNTGTKTAVAASVPVELEGMTAIRVTAKDRTLHFTLPAPAQILLAVIPGDSNDRGFATEAENWNLLYPGAIPLTGKNGRTLSVWTTELPAGANDLNLGKTNFVVLGFVPASTHLAPHAAPTVAGSLPNLDWLFE